MTNTNRATPTATKADYDLFVFGDSLSDVGNFFRASSNLFPPSPPYANGRFSNGPVAVEYLADQLGLPKDTSNNFATAGAQTGRSNTIDPGFFRLGGLLDQVDRFRSQATPLNAGAEDLYLIWAGSNDFLTLPADPAAAVNTAVANIVTAVNHLVQAGAKNIVVAKTPNLGRVPQSLEAGALNLLTGLSTRFNTALEAALTPLDTGDTNIILTDLFTTGETIAQNLAGFGFTNGTTAFLQGVTPADPAADPNQFFFWDQLHPTTRAHHLFADMFRNSVISGISEDITRAGSPSSDKLVSFSGNDRLNGLGGADILEGNDGSDVLHGGSQADILIGGNNRDQLIGGGGADTLQGGLGRDQFIYANPNHGRDLISDFQVGVDRIDIRQIVNRRNYERSDKFAAYVRLRQTGAATIIQVDANGDATGGFTALARLENVGSELTARSFWV